MILGTESRSMNMKDVLSRPLGQLQMGPYEKNMAALARELEKKLISRRIHPNPINLHHWWAGLVQRMNGNNKTCAHLAESVMFMVLYVVDRAVGLMSALTYTASHQSSILKYWTEVQAQPFSTNACQGVQHTTMETMHVQFPQKDNYHQILGWRVDTTVIQRYAARQGIVCVLRINLHQYDSRWMRGSGGSAVHKRISIH